MSTIYSFQRGAVRRPLACTHGEPRDALRGLPCYGRSRLSPSGAFHRGPSPPAPSGGTAATYPGDSPRERPSTGEASPPALPGSAGTASFSPGAESRVPVRARRRRPSRLTEPRPRGGGQPARPDRARVLRSPAALNCQEISPRHSAVGKGVFVPRVVTPARKINAKGVHSTSWREKRS